MLYLKPFLIAILLCFCSVALAREMALKGRVVGVSDGDTITLLVDNKMVKIRFAHVDCPEIKNGQPFGRAAKRFTSDYCFGQDVTILNEGKYDRFHRLIGVVINARGENVNKELVKAGLAWHFLKYSSDASYDALEATARKQRLGLWADPNPIAPWLWRKAKKSKSNKASF
ncbi:MAG: thermonuclease family protein [Bacteroidetes bacterium]|nr:thermonuclease family protein [Bacteroidota bacterium]